MQADPSVIAQAPATLARLKRRAKADRPPPVIEQFEELAAVLASAEEIALEARKARIALAQAVARHRSAGADVLTHAEIGAAFGMTRAAAEVWSRAQ